MRYYLPINQNTGEKENRSPVIAIPWWVWVGLVGCLMLIVLALR